MKKIFLTLVMLSANFAWAMPAFDLRVSRGETNDTLVFSADYDASAYACYLEQTEIKVVGGEIRVSIDDVSPRRCYYIEAPDYGLINLSSLHLNKGLYRVIINDVIQGTLDMTQMTVSKEKSEEPPLNPQEPEFF